MAYLHSDREQFRDAIDLAYEQTGVMVQAIEKDYYVTMLLRLLAQKMPYIVFKRGNEQFAHNRSFAHLHCRKPMFQNYLKKS